jgi:glycosyltransferase involved in cell wall biosynthesis
MVKILIVAPDIARPDIASGDLRFSNVIRLLTDEHQVLFLCPTPKPKKSDPSRNYWDRLESLGIKIITPRYFQHPQTSVAIYNPDVIFCEFWHCASNYIIAKPILLRLNPHIKIIVDSVDLHFVREESGLIVGEGQLDEVSKNKKHEIATYDKSDSVLTVSEADSKILVKHLPNANIAIIPNIVKIMPRGHDLARSPYILFIGGFRHRPNIGAVLWFAKEILPLVQTFVPDATFRIVGSNPPAEILALSSINGVEVVGFVSNTTPLLDQSAVSVAPLLYGGGMKGKVTEALAHGIPVVATDFGIQGLNIQPQKEILVANTREDFAEKVIWVLKHPHEAEMIGKQGQLAITKICGEEIVKERLIEHLTALTKDNNTQFSIRGFIRYSLLRACIVIDYLICSLIRKIRVHLKLPWI